MATINSGTYNSYNPQVASGASGISGFSGSGAGKGALSGGAIGFSVGGPIGGLVGAGLGGLYGAYAGGDENQGSEQEQANRRMMMDYYRRVQGRTAPQMGPAAQGSLSDFRGNQRGLVDHLTAMSQGRGPSLAAQQLRAAHDRNSAQQHSFANSGRGGPLAAQVAANNVGLLGAQSAQDAASARIAEQQMALNQLGLTLHGARGADEEMSRFNTSQTNEARARNLEAQLRTMGYNDDAIAKVMQMMGGSSQSIAGRPSQMDQVMAGAAGAASMYNSYKAAQMPTSTGSPTASDPLAAYRRSEGPITSTKQAY